MLAIFVAMIVAVASGSGVCDFPGAKWAPDAGSVLVHEVCDMLTESPPKT